MVLCIWEGFESYDVIGSVSEVLVCLFFFFVEQTIWLLTCSLFF